MDLTPRDIQQKQFHDTFRGYSHEEVDLFLDEVAEAFDKVFRENQTFHHRLTELEANLTQARGSEDMLKRMLVTAQETADKAVQEARERANSMVSSSQAKSEEILAGAEKSSGEIVAQANDRAKKIVEEAVNKERELQVRIEALKHFESEYRARIKAFIESQLEAVAKGADLPEVPGSQPVSEPISQANVVPTAPRMPQQPTGMPVSSPADSAEEPLTPNLETPPPVEPNDRVNVHQERSSLESVVVDPDTDPVTARVPAGGVPDHSEGSDKPDQDRSIRELFWGEE